MYIKHVIDFKMYINSHNHNRWMNCVTVAQQRKINISIDSLIIKRSTMIVLRCSSCRASLTNKGPKLPNFYFSKIDNEMKFH